MQSRYDPTKSRRWSARRDFAEGELLTVGQVSRTAGVTRRTVYNWIHDGACEVVLSPKGTMRVVGSSLWGRPDRGAGLPGRPHTLETGVASV
jgi:hypothetical protein